MATLNDDPEAAVIGLKRFGFGVLHLIESWERLERSLVERGWWNELERDEAIRLLGWRPEPETLPRNPVAWLTRFYNLICRPNARDNAFAWLFHKSHLPDEFRNEYAVDFHPDAEYCRNWLRERVAEELASLRQQEERLRTELDDPDYAATGERASILRDEKTARVFLRYHAESRTSFQRAYSALVRTINARSEGPVTMAELAASPNGADRVDEPSPVGRVEHAIVPPGGQDGVLHTPDEGPSPNEANPAPEPSSTACEASTSVETEAKKSKTKTGTRKAYDPKEDVGMVIMELLYQEKLAAGGSEVVPISIVGAGS